MGDPAKTTKQPGIFSRDFVLRERLVKLIPSGGDDNSEDTSYVQDVWSRVAGRWVYVFRMLGDEIKWHAEYRVDDKGDYYPADMSKAADKDGNPTKERQDRQPLNEMPDPKNRHEKLAFHHTINGKRAYYAFYLSNARLPLDSIKKMITADLFKSLQPPDLREDSDYRVHSPWDDPAESTDARLQETPGYPDKIAGEIYISVFDVLTYGMSLNRVMQQLRDLALAWFIPAKYENEDQMKPEQRANLEAQRKRTAARQKKWILARALKALVDNEQTIGANISGYLHKGDLENFIAHYDDVREKRLNDLETWAKKLTDWLDQKLTAFTVEAHMTLMTVDAKGCEDDLARFMTAYAACMDRLMESTAGFQWLSKTVADKNHFLHPWVLNTSTSPRDYLKVFRKASKAFYWMFKEIFLPYRAQFKITKTKNQSLAAQHYTTHENAYQRIDYQIVPSTFLFDTLEVETYTNKAGQKVTVQKTVQHIDIEDTSHVIDARQFGSSGARGTPPPPPQGSGSDGSVGTKTNPTGEDVDSTGAPRAQKSPPFEPVLTTIVTKETPHWSRGLTDADVAKIQKSMNQFFKVTGALNLGLAIYDLADQGVDRWRLLKSISALGTTVTAFEEISAKKLSKMTLKEISLVTAIIDVVTSTHDVLKASDRGDMTAAGGYIVAGVGSGIVALGTGLAIFGVETSWTGIGLALALIGAAISMFGGSAPLEDFAKHCVWGRSYGQDGGDAKWQEGPFSGWHEKNPDGLDRQLRVMFHLLGAFRVHGLNSLLHIDFGIVPAKVNIKYTCIQYGGYAAGGYAYNSEIVVDLLNRTAEQVSAPPDKQTQTYIRIDDSFVIVLQQFEDVRNPGKFQDWPCYCEVRLDVQGDQSLWTPGSGAWVPYYVEYDESFANMPASYTDPKARLADDELLTPGTGGGADAPHTNISVKTVNSIDY